ncbi:MAG: 5'-nucleotidase C-terminal domain-containing protein [Bacteroidales bacterium]|nr:5'-nucleotidase C-terminal domain-containing protein [Bacteroides sp.]MCM1198990.1 5'-nucleotidase C-terminal domain-containing protein [Clostridium sp.]MCM1501299.1 5'-nucleotidase C-terminal domain-containing protein [Bacteroidales bacterium]
MVKAKVILLTLAMLPMAASAGVTPKWKRNIIDGSRTGVSVPLATDVEKSLGTVKGKTYTAPNGKVYKGGSVYKVASLVTDAQPVMAPVKEVIAYSPEAMTKAYPESALTNWFIDNLMASVEEASGRKVDVGIGNFGGVRVDMPKGDVLVDDIRSMFPFRNDIVYVALKGRDVRAMLENMAATRFQIVGGVRVTAKDGKIVSAEIGGEPIDDEKVYGVATISFLLNGGDRLFVARNAVEVIPFQIDIYEAMMGQIKKDVDAGRPIEGKADGRVVIIKDAE